MHFAVACRLLALRRSPILVLNMVVDDDDRDGVS
jgi:hypothetical protein